MTTCQREQRGKEIAAMHSLSKDKGGWIVPSSSSNRKYRVTIIGKKSLCTCSDFETTGEKCKHIYAVQFSTKKVRPVGRPPKRNVDRVEIKRPTYKQKWDVYNEAQTREKEIVPRLLQGLCEGIVQPKQKMGRPKISIADVVFGATMKVYGTLSGRRTDYDLKGCTDKGFMDSTPHYNTIFKYLEDPMLTPILKALIEESALPLKDVETHFGPDSTGVAAGVYSRWFDEKFGKAANQLVWNKVHLMVGLNSKIVTAVEFTDPSTHDNTQFASLVNATAKNFTMKEVAADKAYLSKDNLELVASHGAVPYIPFKSNTTGEGPELWKKMYHLHQFKRSEFLEHYHKRSNAETAMWMIKSKFGERVRSRLPVSLENEALCKVLCHNLWVLTLHMFKIGIEPSFLKLAA